MKPQQLEQILDNCHTETHTNTHRIPTDVIEFTHTTLTHH